MKIGLLHFSGPPMIGGVEQTLYYQAKQLALADHEPIFIVGEGEAVFPESQVIRIPQLFSRHPEVLSAKAELDAGHTGPHYQELLQVLSSLLHEITPAMDVLLVHNALTLHKNLALTQALWDLYQAGDLPPLIGWHHDFAWSRPDYHAELHDGLPWEASLYGIDPDQITVIPPGVDPAITGQWTELTQQLVSELRLLEAAVLLLLPARITRRKNIELAIQIHAEFCQQTEKDIRLIVSGPPGPHNPTNIAYLERLLQLAQDLGFQKKVHFLYQLGPTPPLSIDDDTMANLYGLCDALLFPSSDEGFGIPILEAGLVRMPIFCSDLSPFKESGRGQIHIFDLSEPPQEIARRISDTIFKDNAYILRERVRREFTWQHIVRDKLIPMCERLLHD